MHSSIFRVAVSETPCKQCEDMADGVDSWWGNKIYSIKVYYKTVHKVLSLITYIPILGTALWLGYDVLWRGCVFYGGSRQYQVWAVPLALPRLAW